MGSRVSFHTFTLPKDRCVRLLVKNLGRGMPESVVREELDSRSCDPGVAIRNTPRTALTRLTSSCQWREGRVSKVRALNELSGLWVLVES
jgi:hypothetical protein